MPDHVSRVPENYAHMSEADRTRFHFSALCRRLHRIDQTCNLEQGCPVELVALPMIRAWKQQQTMEVPDDVSIALAGMLARSDGNACNIGNIVYFARTFARVLPMPLRDFILNVLKEEGELRPIGRLSVVGQINRRTSCSIGVARTMFRRLEAEGLIDVQWAGAWTIRCASLTEGR